MTFSRKILSTPRVSIFVASTGELYFILITPLNPSGVMDKEMRARSLTLINQT